MRMDKQKVVAMLPESAAWEQRDRLAEMLLYLARRLDDANKNMLGGCPLDDMYPCRKRSSCEDCVILHAFTATKPETDHDEND